MVCVVCKPPGGAPVWRLGLRIPSTPVGDDDSDDSDEDFNEEDESDEEDGSESDSDDDVELVDEPDFKISDLKQRLDDEDDKGTATKAKKETEEPKMEEPKTEEPKKE